VALLGIGAPLTLATGVAGAAGVTPSYTYTPGTPTLDTITDGASAAPWNPAQGDPAGTAYGSSQLLPTYTPGGSTTTLGGTTEPNLAVYPAATGATPYPSGVVGTPGPLDAYCGTGTNAAEVTGTPARQPSGTTLPFSPAYFPHVVANSDGTLTGYFDERPKDADESLVAATSSDGGRSWTYQGQALEQNTGYCPTADTNDDGEGHANLLSVGGVSRVYTLQRPAGDNAGVGLLVHTPSGATEANPLAGLPATERVGVDPDAFATAAVAVPATGGSPATVAVTQTGLANSPEQLVAGPFVDLTQTPVPTAASVITCTGVTAGAPGSLTGCTSAAAGGTAVAVGDLIEQVVGIVNTAETVPAGPNVPAGTGGLPNLPITFSDNLTATILNNNAPDRVYVNGTAVYCTQANANPTQKLEDCTAPGGALTAAVGAPVTADPVVPATAQQTTGLVAPDGIVGTLPSFPNDGSVPSGAVYVLYTEKVLNAFQAGVTSAAGTYSSTTGTSIAFYANPNTATDLPTPTVASPVTVDVADDKASVKAVIPATCTGLATGTGSLESNAAPLTDTLTGCTVPAAYNGDTYTTKDQIGAPGATLESPASLAKTGEGSTNQDKLYKNNEDLTVLRVAWTTDGVDFSAAGLADGGVISGQGTEGSGYDDINDPTATADPSGGLNAYATPGTADATEMRWVGSAGTVLTNPDGTYGLFLSGAWSADGDSDAFNQVFYTTSADGEHWSVPVSVVSTDYTFAASVAQDAALAGGTDQPLGVSAYYSGRAYGPSVVQLGDGSTVMIFAGYRLPKPITAAGTSLGTNGAAPYTVGATDPALYRDILTVPLTVVATGGDPGDGAPESPVTVVLPLAAVGILGGAVVARRRRHRPT